jgi:two-component system, LuxR family, response regulator FixJ
LGSTQRRTRNAVLLHGPGGRKSGDMTAVATVHIVDDDAGVRKSLRLLMESASLAVRVYESGEEFLDAVDLNQPGCMVLDLRMPGMSGIEVLQKLRDANNEIPAIVISGHADVPTTIRSMKLGAIDLLEKPFEPRALLDAVHGAIRNSIEQQRHRAEQDGIRKRLSKLTPRELVLLKLVVAGMPNKLIAAELGISIKTVANHRASLMKKTQALNAADLSRLSTIAGIRPPE